MKKDGFTKMKYLKMAAAFSLLILLGCAGFDAETINRALEGPLDSETVAAGLKEALRIGTERSTATTSARDGFYGNALIRIALPEQYTGVADALRKFGMGSQVDAFELSMNRAAEKASGEAVAVFWESITKMSISDAFGILNGGDTAATEYFRRQTSTELQARFQPIVILKMEEVGVYRLYEDLVSTYNMLPIEKPAAVDLDDYITERTVDGIFLILEEEEQRIREDPAARTTALLRKVFG